MRIPLPMKGETREIVAGIDLGTTNSLSAWVVDGQPVVIPDRQGRTITPSVISIDEEHHPVVGDEAQERALINAEGTISSVKRFMGRGLDDINEDLNRLPYMVVRSSRSEQIAVRTHGKEYAPQELSAMILAEVKRRAERALGGRLRKAVITVPAYFDDAQRQATRDAGRMAGIDVLRIINEPTAAALAYGLDANRSGTVLVYDLGGGTFDVSVLRLTEGIFKVVGTTGNTSLGGDDFDHAVVDLLMTELPPEQAQLLSDLPRGRLALKLAAEQAKIALSAQDETQVCLSFDELDISIERRISRSQFDEAIAPLVERTIESVEFVLDEAELGPEDIDDVICVGGSTRTPLVRSRLESFFGRKPHTDLNPDEVVALGAAIQANTLAGTGSGEGVVLLDVTPLSLGIETYGGGSTKLIWRNSPIPLRATEGFTTYVDNQTVVDIHVLQGEREMVQDLRSLGRFKLKGIPPMSAGMPRVLVEFFIDANGILEVKAKEMTSGTEAGIEVTPTYGLTDEQVEEMILDSIENAEEDMEAHLLADTKAEAGSILRYSKKVLAERQDLVPPPLAKQIQAAIDGLEAVLEGSDREQIDAAMQVLNENTAPVAADLMNEVLKVTVTGKSIGEVLGDKPRSSARDIQLT
ncbi:MAG: Fe-S protein assembly chaperone HscA [Myxococcota bacterium]|nr:Fe-S protein assembly chaperone HscA [Myxococcota bacterium]